ncbi:MAG: CPP1-like family protein [Kiritimatiellaeota bacterium]|nr:CPP1-like family protein [Kiritimatiellota bacterium]
MSDDKQTENAPAERNRLLLIRFWAIMLTVVTMGALIAGLTYGAGILAFAAANDNSQWNFLFVLVGAIPLTIAVLTFACVYKKGKSLKESRAGVRVFWRTVLWTLGAFLIGGLLFFGTCATQFLFFLD